MDHLISIDEENRIRALPAEKFKESELLLKASTEFRNSLSFFFFLKIFRIKRFTNGV